jgi:hypothetical protein
VTLVSLPLSDDFDSLQNLSSSALQVNPYSGRDMAVADIFVPLGERDCHLGLDPSAVEIVKTQSTAGVTPSKDGVQRPLRILDSGFRRNDGQGGLIQGWLPNSATLRLDPESTFRIANCAGISAEVPLRLVLLLHLPKRFHASDIERLSHGRPGDGPTRVLFMGSAGLRAGYWLMVGRDAGAHCCGSQVELGNHNLNDRYHAWKRGMVGVAAQNGGLRTMLCSRDGPTETRVTATPVRCSIVST